MKGDEASMRTFYERYYGFALSVCLAYTNNQEDARELLNDGFLKIFKHLKTLQDAKTIMPWIRRIMVNTGIDYYRKNKQKVPEISLDEVAYSLAENNMSDTQILAKISAEEIIKVLQTIPLTYRIVFSLYVLEGYSHAEIAEKLGIVESTSRAHLTEANKRLRKALNIQNEHGERTKQ